MQKIDKGYRIFKKAVSSDTSKSLFIAFNETINFVTQKNKKFKSWNDKKLHEFLINLRVKNKEKFSMIYDLIQKNSVLEEFGIKNNLKKISNNFLYDNEKNLTMRVQLRIDPPVDTRNLYNWHQDSSYDNFNFNPKNGVVLWMPLIDAMINEGAPEIKPKSHSEKTVFILHSKWKKFQTPQLTVPKKYLDKYVTKIVPMKRNSCLCMFANLFHKSGKNISNKVRFTVIARFNKINSKDFYLYRKSKAFKNPYN